MSRPSRRLSLEALECRFTPSARPGVFLLDPLQIVPTARQALAPGLENQPYAQTFTALGGGGVYTFHPPAGPLDGLIFRGAGSTLTLGGTPARAGTFPFTLSLSDAWGNTLIQAYTLRIGAAPLRLTATLQPARVGTPCTLRFAAGGGTGSYSWSLPGFTGGGGIPGLAFS
jgi:hypothetical protein